MPLPTPPKLNVVLRSWRQISGLTQKQLASELGKHIQTIWQYEAGTRIPNYLVQKSWKQTCEKWARLRGLDLPNSIEG
jgi:transcriptional regulator with XRE-family HTH domain